jgi:hypothetical protein
VPGPGVVVERSYIPSQPYEIAKNGEKNGGFAHVLAYNSPKTQVFAIKYLTRYTHETFFEEYITIKFFRNLSHCGVIPVRSFGSHIRPQPHGLGLKAFLELARRQSGFQSVPVPGHTEFWGCVSSVGWVLSLALSK